MSPRCTACAVTLTLAQAATHACPVPEPIDPDQTEPTLVEDPLPMGWLRLVSCPHGSSLDAPCSTCERT